MYSLDAGDVFDYMIAILAQKLVKIDVHEIGSFSKTSKIFKKNQFFSTKIRFLTRFHPILFSPIFKLE